MSKEMAQTTVNGEVQEVFDTTEYILEVLISIWEMVPIEMKMYVGVMYATSAVLQTYKLWFLAGEYKKERVAKMRKMSTVFAVILSGVAYYIYKDTMHIGWFIFAALTAARSVMYAHYVFVDVIAPILKIIKKWVMDRVYLTVTGKPKSE